MPYDMSLEAALKRDRAFILGGLIVLTGLAWTYMFYLAWNMPSMEMPRDMTMPQMQTWTALDLLLMFIMWAVMMVAMMIPSASPMILLFATVNRQRQARQQPFVPTTIFLAGYLCIWTGFSLVATILQWRLHEAALLSPMMVSTSPICGGLLLLAAGIFQWTPLKHTCLKHCRSPLDFVMAKWRQGTHGAFIMGLQHGLYCTGCCWFLMALLFISGVMNLLWVAIISVFVLAEKVVPKGEIVGRATGVVLVLAGIMLISQVLY